MTSFLDCFNSSSCCTRSTADDEAIMIEANMDYHSTSGRTESVQFPISPVRARGPGKLPIIRTSNAREQWPDRQIGSQPESPLHIGAKTRSCNLTHALEFYQAGNYLAAMKICRAILASNQADYEAQLLLGRSLASYKMTKHALEAFRAATKINGHEYRGWKNLCDIVEATGKRDIELFDVYLALLTIAKPSTKDEWNRICEKMLALHLDLGGKRMMNLQLRNLKTFAGYPNFDDAVLCRWRDIVYAFPTTKFTSKVEESLMKAACRLVKDSSQCSQLDQMKCDILLSMTCKERWTEVEAKCLRMHQIFPSEKLPLRILANQYIKSDMGCLQDKMIRIYERLYQADRQSALAAIGRGQSLLAQNNYESAIIWLSRGVSLDKQNVYGWLYLAKAQLATNNHKEAYKSSVRGLELLKEKANTSSTSTVRSQLEHCRSKAALESNDCMAAISSITDWIPQQSLKEGFPSDLYKKLIQACKRLHNQRQSIRNSGSESLQDWKRGQRADYHLQHAIKHWHTGMETRTDPWMFLTSILKALKQDPWNADVFFLLGRYLWETLAEPSLAKDFLELARNLRPDGETCAYLVDICMVLQETTKAAQIVTSSLHSSPNTKWAWLRLGLLQMRERNFNSAETSFWEAIKADSRSNRQPYECLARNRLHLGIFAAFDARNAFATGAKLEPDFGHQLLSPISATNVTDLEATDLRAIYSDGQQWITNPQGKSVQFAFSILYAICPELLRPLGFDFSKVTTARKAITRVYSNGGLGRGECNDWGGADKQCAYMLRFFLIHCQFVPQLLISTPNILSVFPSGNHIRVCCVGGGPGSDIIGLMSFLRSINRNARLTCHVLDKFTAWSNVWKTIQPRLPPPSVNAEYLPLDITATDALDSRVIEAIRKADIVTFVKSVSPAVTFLKNSNAIHQKYPFLPVQSHRGAIPTILSSLKSGALLIYIDNKFGDQNKLFLGMAKTEGLILVNQKIWQCDISANVGEYNAVWNGHGCNACESVSVQGYIFYKR